MACRGSLDRSALIFALELVTVADDLMAQRASLWCSRGTVQRVAEAQVLTVPGDGDRART